MYYILSLNFNDINKTIVSINCIDINTKNTKKNWIKSMFYK